MDDDVKSGYYMGEGIVEKKEERWVFKEKKKGAVLIPKCLPTYCWLERLESGF